MIAATGPRHVSEPVYPDPRMAECLARLRELHPRVCPRQVLGVRIGLEAGSLLGLDLPRSDKRILVFVETDGCFADGVSVATGCWLGRRTLRLIDYGKVAATVVDVAHGRAFRLWPHPEARLRASSYVPEATSRWRAQLWGYQIMPIGQLLCSRPAELEMSLSRLVGHPGRAICTVCGEEIMNQRGLRYPDGTRCQSCAGGRTYYRELDRLGARRTINAGGSGSGGSGPDFDATDSKAHQLQHC